MSLSCQPGEPFNPAGESSPFGRDKAAHDLGPLEYPHQPVDLSSSKCSAATPVIRIQQGQRTRIQVQPLDRNGSLIALPALPEAAGGSSSTGADPFRYRLICDHYTGARLHVFDIWGTVVDRANSVIEFTLTEAETSLSGVFAAHLLIHNQASTDHILHATAYWLEIAATSLVESNGPPTIAEIRMLLRDECADPESVIGDYEFSDHEIAVYIQRPVDQFNVTRPPITSYTVSNFPRQYRFYWTKATLGMLLRARGADKMRNALTYQAGGTSVNDNDKYADYFRLADTYLKEWEAFILEQKTRMNLDRAWGVVHSDYGRGAVMP